MFWSPAQAWTIKTLQGRGRGSRFFIGHHTLWCVYLSLHHITTCDLSVFACWKWSTTDQTEISCMSSIHTYSYSYHWYYPHLLLLIMVYLFLTQKSESHAERFGSFAPIRKDCQAKWYCGMLTLCGICITTKNRLVVLTLNYYWQVDICIQPLAACYLLVQSVLKIGIENASLTL